MGLLSKFFGPKNPLDVPVKELMRDQMRLEAQIEKIERELRAIEAEIAELFERAKKAQSRSEELTIATKIKTLNKRKKNLQATHAQLNKQLMLVSNLIIIKENEELLRGTPTWELLRKMSPSELEEKLIAMELDARNFNESLEKMLGMTDRTIGVEDFEADEELEEILSTIRAVKEGELEPEEATRKVVEREVE
jgi:hypothetical protein